MKALLCVCVLGDKEVDGWGEEPSAFYYVSLHDCCDDWAKCLHSFPYEIDELVKSPVNFQIHGGPAYVQSSGQI